AVAEAQLLRHADADLAQPPAVATHRDRAAAEAGIDLDEGLFHFVGRDRERRFQLQVLVRNLDLGPRLARALEIGAGSKAGAGAVPVPFAKDEPRRRHETT